MHKAGRAWQDRFTFAIPARFGPIFAQPKVFKHNERWCGWFAWVCRFCDIVKLEDTPGPEEWLCEICRIRGVFPCLEGR